MIKEENGIWVKYSDYKDSIKLYNSVSSVDAAWKIKDKLGADYYLRLGFVYVYYTIDENCDYTIPRIYIITNKYNRVSYAWGIDKYENIEVELLDVLDKKLDEINDKKFLHKPRIADLKLLNLIYNKTIQGIDLNIDEIRFLYEFDREIKYFGFSKDAKVAELRKIRDTKQDMNKVFRTMDEYEGNLVLNFPSYGKGIIFPRHIKGDFVLKKVTNLSNCILPEIVEGSIDLQKVKKMKNVLFGEKTGNDFFARELQQTDYVIFPESIGGDFYADNLSTAKSTIYPNSVSGKTILVSLDQKRRNNIRIYAIGNFEPSYELLNESIDRYQEIKNEILKNVPQDNFGCEEKIDNKKLIKKIKK